MDMYASHFSETLFRVSPTGIQQNHNVYMLGGGWTRRRRRVHKAEILAWFGVVHWTSTHVLQIHKLALILKYCYLNFIYLLILTELLHQKWTLVSSDSGALLLLGAESLACDQTLLFHSESQMVFKPMYVFETIS
jgi:hypothetical protein